MLDLSTNIELKEETFSKIQSPKIKFFWKDGSVDEKDFSDLIISANGTIEMEDFNGNLTKNSFNIDVDNNNDDDLNAPGFFFPESTGAIGENIRIEVGFEHTGSGSETVKIVRGKIRTLEGNTQDKSAQITGLDEGKNLDYEITVSEFLKNKYPFEIIEKVANQVGYYTTNAEGNKKLIIRSLSTPSIDESLFLISYFAISADIGWEIVNKVCEASLGKFFINRNGDFEYWTYNYWVDKFSEDNENYDFTAKTLISDTDTEIVPILEQNINVAYNNLINSCETNYYNFKKQENADLSDITVELAPGETFHVEEDYSSQYIETLQATNLWNTFAFEYPDFSGTDHGTDLVITNVTNTFKKIEFDIKNNGSVYYYCQIKPKVTLQWLISQKIIKKKESNTDFTDGDYNYNLNKESKKSIQNELVQNKEWASALNLKYITLYRKPIREVEIKTTGFPQLDLGDVGKYLNYIETKSTTLFAWIKKIDWNFNLSDGFIFSILSNVISSSSGLLSQYIFEYFDNNNKIDLNNSNVILDGGKIYNISEPDGFIEDFNLKIIDSFGGDYNSPVNIELIDIPNSTVISPGSGTIICANTGFTII